MSDSEMIWGRLRPQVLQKTGCVHIEYEPEDERLKVVVFGEDLSLDHDKMRELGIRLFETIDAFSRDQSDG